MNIKEAKEVLAKNVLDLSTAGMDYMPMNTVEIETFEIMNKKDNERTSWNEKAYLIGLIDKDKEQEDSRRYLCCSFVVKVWHDYYYREYFSEAMEVIEALKIVNGYKDPHQD